MEISLLRWIHVNLHGVTWLNYAMKYITLLGEHAAFCIALCVILLIIKETRKCGFALAISLALNILIVNVILKNVIARERPWIEYTELVAYYNRYDIYLPSDYSFPSGHAAACFCAATILAIFYKAKAAVPSFIIAILVAFSRVWLCVHYPSDVVAGALIGMVCAVAGYFIYRLINGLYVKHRHV